MAQFERIVTKVEKNSVASRIAGSVDHPAFVFLHGWPQSSRSYESIMRLLMREFFVLAIDLPGVSGSRGAPISGEKATLAKIVREVIRVVNARAVVLVGHDAGGMIAFSYLRQFGTELDGAVIANTVIPGVYPWEKVIANPRIWHFGFHSIPNLPETLVAGHQREYFDFFFDALASDKSSLTKEARDAYASDYASVDALRAGFGWYRAFPKDAKQNEARIDVDTPLLYVRGDKEQGDINEYVQGLKSSGMLHVSSRIIPKCGHFSPDEAPEALARVLREFREHCNQDARATLKIVSNGRR
jgi:pimeloyl-ACP methyl ester carboxylesterase